VWVPWSTAALCALLVMLAARFSPGGRARRRVDGSPARRDPDHVLSMAAMFAFGIARPVERGVWTSTRTWGMVFWNRRLVTGVVRGWDLRRTETAGGCSVVHASAFTVALYVGRGRFVFFAVFRSALLSSTSARTSRL